MMKLCSCDLGSENNEKKVINVFIDFLEFFFFMKKFDSFCLERYVNFVKRLMYILWKGKCIL